jgi:hypothetical protein
MAVGERQACAAAATTAVAAAGGGVNKTTCELHLPQTLVVFSGGWRCRRSKQLLSCCGYIFIGEEVFDAMLQFVLAMLACMPPYTYSAGYSAQRAHLRVV